MSVMRSPAICSSAVARIFRPRRGQDGVQAFGEVLALLRGDARGIRESKLPELRIDFGQ